MTYASEFLTTLVRTALGRDRADDPAYGNRNAKAGSS